MTYTDEERSTMQLHKMTHETERAAPATPLTADEKATLERHHMTNESVPAPPPPPSSPAEQSARLAHHMTNESADSPWAPISEIVGDVVERNVDLTHFAYKAHAPPSTSVGAEGRSLFAREMEARAASLHAKRSTPHEAGVVHATKAEVGAENDRLLEGMTNEEIMSERAALVAKMDPKLVAYLQKKKAASAEPVDVSMTSVTTEEDVSVGVASLEIITAPTSSSASLNYTLLDSASRVAAVRQSIDNQSNA